jgi:hypothetical protein
MYKLCTVKARHVCKGQFLGRNIEDIHMNMDPETHPFQVAGLCIFRNFRLSLLFLCTRSEANRGREKTEHITVGLLSNVYFSTNKQHRQKNHRL